MGKVVRYTGVYHQKLELHGLVMVLAILASLFFPDVSPQKMMANCINGEPYIIDNVPLAEKLEKVRNPSNRQMSCLLQYMTYNLDKEKMDMPVLASTTGRVHAFVSRINAKKGSAESSKPPQK